jgi:uncharacterized membrane protein YhaH (DUF805 family)
MFDALKKYAVFSGRARRREYWLFILLAIIIHIIGIVIDLGMETFGSLTGGLVTTLVSLALAIPIMSVGVRRLHDTNRSGWWYLLSLIPLANLALIVLFCLNGTAGDNRFGADPKAA